MNQTRKARQDVVPLSVFFHGILISRMSPEICFTEYNFVPIRPIVEFISNVYIPHNFFFTSVKKPPPLHLHYIGLNHTLYRSSIDLLHLARYILR